MNRRRPSRPFCSPPENAAYLHRFPSARRNCRDRTTWLRLLARNVSDAYFGGATDHEIVDSCLRFDAFVEMVMTCKHKRHAILHEQRFQSRPQRQIGTVPGPGGVDRMVKIGDLPIAS